MVPFYGQEYEDAYEYVYSGIFFLESPRAANSGLNPICLKGNLENCSVVGDLSHPIGAGGLYSLLLWMTGSVPGSRIFATGLLSSLGLFALLAAWPHERQGIACASLVLVSATPLVGLYSITGFAEVAGAAVLASFILAWCLCWEKDRSLGTVPLMLLTVSSALLPLVKRELMLVPALAAVFALATLRRRPRKKTAVIATHLAAGALLALLVSRGAIFDLAVVRSSKHALLSMATLIQLVPMFVKQAVTSMLFIPFGVLLLSAVIVGWRWSATRPATMIATALLLLGLSFSQSYYFALNGGPPTIHFERYSYILWPLVAAILAYAGSRVAVFNRLQYRRLARPVLIGLLVAYVIACATSTAVIATERHRDEVAVRFAPVVQAVRLVPADGWVLTLDPILVALVDPETQVIDLPSLATNFSNKMFEDFVATHDLWLLLPQHGLSVEEARYKSDFALVSQYSWEAVKGQMSGGLYRVLQVAPRDGNSSTKRRGRETPPLN